MRSITSIAVLLVLVGFSIGSGCTLGTTSKDERSVGALQLQKSLSLTAGRFTQILSALDAGKAEQAKKDLDWWLDLAILELAALEESDPNKQWGEVMIDSDSGLKMKTAYKRLVQYRKSHPRLHSIPLEPAEQRRIDAFVEKYR
jgi:hypothetical protein